MTFDEKRRVDYDIMSLRHSLNINREENNRLKEQMKSIKQEVKFKDLHLKKLFNKATHIFCAQKKPSLRATAETELKNHVHQLQREIEKARRQKEELAHSCRDSTLQEAQNKLRNSLECCRRLRVIIQSAKTEPFPSIMPNYSQLLLKNQHLLSIIEKQSYELDRLRGVSRGRVKLSSCIRVSRRGSRTAATPLKSATRKNLLVESEPKKDSTNITQEEMREEVVEISEEEKKLSIARLRLILMSAKITKDSIKNIFANKYQADDKITVQDFEKILKRKPIQAAKELARNVAITLGHKLFSKETAGNIVKRLISLIPDYSVSEKKAMDKALSKKVANLQKELSEMSMGNVVNGEDVRKRAKDVGLELTSEECDYLAVVAYKKTKDVKKLQGKAIVQYLRGLCNLTKKPIKKQTDESEVINIDEEKIIEIAHNFFLKFAKRIRAEEITLRELYGDRLEQVEVESREVDVLSPEVFIAGLSALGLELADPIEYACVIKILALNDDEKLLKFEYLVEIISDYGVAPAAEEAAGDFISIDEISLIIILALSEHLVKNKSSLQALLGPKVYVQGNAEVIGSEDFFEIVEQIGVALESREHVKLKELLCVDAAHKNTLSLAKIKQLVDEFLRNEQLQDRAIKCYEDLMKKSGEIDKQKMSPEFSNNPLVNFAAKSIGAERLYGVPRTRPEPAQLLRDGMLFLLRTTGVMSEVS